MDILKVVVSEDKVDLDMNGSLSEVTAGTLQIIRTIYDALCKHNVGELYKALLINRLTDPTCLAWKHFDRKSFIKEESVELAPGLIEKMKSWFQPEEESEAKEE